MPMSIKRNPIKHKNSDFFITYGIPHTAPTQKRYKKQKQDSKLEESIPDKLIIEFKPNIVE